jgi:hypothetical protein
MTHDEAMNVLADKWTEQDREEYVSAYMLDALRRALFVLESPALIHITNGGGTVDVVRRAIELAEQYDEAAPTTNPEADYIRKTGRDY